MRIPKKFGERTEPERTIARKYYLVYEGTQTEVQYFNGILNNKEKLNINLLLEIIPILRSYNEEQWSNPKKILDCIIGYIESIGTKDYTVDSFSDKVIDWLVEERYITEKTVYNKETIKPKLVALLGLDKEIEDLSEATTKVANFLTSELDIKNAVDEIEKYIKCQNITYDPEYDKLCLITDRDKQSFKEDQYDYVLETCKQKGYCFYVTNPCFEFWILLHYNEVFNYNRNDLLENKKESVKAKKRFIEKQLSILMGGYNKDKLNFEKLVGKVDTAITNEKQFCEDSVGLKTNLGSNVGLLLSEMMESSP